MSRICRAALLLAGIMLAASCGGKKAAELQDKPLPRMDARWHEIISGHTAGVVSRHAGIQVRFARDVVATERMDPAAAAVFELEPPAAGSARFLSPREWTFTPSAALLPGQEYVVRLKPRELAGLPEGLTPYAFSFRTLAPDFEVRVTGLQTGGGDGALSLDGSLETADGEDPGAVEKMLVASLAGSALPLTWAHFNDNRSHHFKVAGIRRGEENARLLLTWNAATLGLDAKGQRAIDVPAEGVFSVLDTSLLREGRQSVQVRFSEALDADQNFEGLVRLGEGKVTTRVEGNALTVYPTQALLGTVDLVLDPGLRNSAGRKLKREFRTPVTFVNEKPQVRFAGKGVILPQNTALSIPIEAMNVHSVQVTAFQVYEQNLGQFLQANKLDGEQELGRTGRFLWRKTLKLPDPQADAWTRFALDASELLRAHPGALFRLTLSINRGNSLYPCAAAGTGPAAFALEEPYEDNEDLDVREAGGWDGIEDYYNTDAQQRWQDRDDPCTDSYFRWGQGTRESRNFLGSNIGLIAKRGKEEDSLSVAATRLHDAAPLAGARIDAHNFQNQVIGSGTTDEQGLVRLKVQGTPFYLVAREGDQVGYLKTSRGTALPTSHFDTGGEAVSGGIKGFLYGERGVWRPGDPIHLTFVLEDKTARIPDGHPVTLQLFDPRGQLALTQTNATPVDDFYRFVLPLAEDAPTGNWTAKALLGGAEFSKLLKVETVMPNRLKLELDFGAESLRRERMPSKAKLSAQWLHGASAAGLKAEVSVKLVPMPTTFSRNTDFTFDDPTRPFSSDPVTLFEGTLGKDGVAEFEAQLEPSAQAPGLLSAVLTSRVFEPGGAFSTSHGDIPFHPYERYVGLKLPKGDAVRGMLLTDLVHTVELASLDPDGQPASAPDVEVTLYKIDWRWWWDQTREDLTQFESASHYSQLQQGKVAIANGKGAWTFEIKYPDWGRYLVRACDAGTGHCAARVFYADWPGWAGRAQEQSGPGANALAFFSDKARYQVGDIAFLQLPEASRGRALLSAESGSRVLEQRWIEVSKERARLELPVTARMAPNVYVSVTLVQPHAGKDNDRPIRLYGVIPLLVSDPATELNPRIVTGDGWRPNSTETVKVSEAGGREMTYTLAIVDEGLLGLTGFKTPNPHGHFYKREALGVLSWDLFDDVAGAYGGALERLLALGGDEGGPVVERQEEKRFPPVVEVLGPFHLNPGQTQAHKITLPNYIGAVRVMVVAGFKGRYGTSDKGMIVRDPVSVLATLPRVLGPGESLQVPVSAFVFEPSLREVRLGVEAVQGLTVEGESQATLRFDAPGEKLASFHLQVEERIGKARVKVAAQAGKHRTHSEIHVDVRPQNPPTVRELTQELDPGEEWKPEVRQHGVGGSGTVTLEVSSVPPFDLERRLQYLVQYPHGCVEQLTSASFPQLYLEPLGVVGADRRKEIERNVAGGIEQLRRYQAPSGGFNYWPGDGAMNAWADNYAGHFLSEARRLGYAVPPEMFDAWIEHQRSVAAAWVAGGDGAAETQAYRLLTLAIGERADVGAMNRLRETPNLPALAAWQLAAAYAHIGLKDAAREVMRAGGRDVRKYAKPGQTFGSDLRDRAILLQALMAVDDRGAFEVAEQIARQLSSAEWYSTQSTAYGLLAMARYLPGRPGQDFAFEYARGGATPAKIQSARPLHVQRLDGIGSQSQVLTVRNVSDRKLHASILVEGSAPAGDEQPAASGLALEVSYRDTRHQNVQVDRLAQGTDFIATVKVTNRSGASLDDLALTHVVASGWEINNPRFTPDEAQAPATADYQDIRDDRVLSYFKLGNGESRTFEVLLDAAYLGRYYLPAVQVESMYDARKHAHTAGRWVEVVKP